jgi:hypothetical protein
MKLSRRDTPTITAMLIFIPYLMRTIYIDIVLILCTDILIIGSNS